MCDILKSNEQSGGLTAKQLIADVGISLNTFYIYKRRYPDEFKPIYSVKKGIGRTHFYAPDTPAVLRKYLVRSAYARNRCRTGWANVKCRKKKRAVRNLNCPFYDECCDKAAHNLSPTVGCERCHLKNYNPEPMGVKL